MITLLEPPRPAGLTSGGFRYQERVVSALGSAARRVTTAPERLTDCVQALRRSDPQGEVVVDGWFADLQPAPLPAEATPLLHMVPATSRWSAASRRVLTTSEVTAAAVRDRVAQVTVVRPGVDACFSPRPRSGRTDDVALVCAGAICEAKGQRRLLEALRGVAAPWRLTLVGSSTAPAAEVDAVRRAAAGLPVTILGAVSAEQLAALYAEHDLFVTLSRSESYGMAAAEAAAAGLPLLGTDTGELNTFGVEAARWLLPVDFDDADARALLRRWIEAPRALRALRGRGAVGRRTWEQAAAELRAALS